MLGPAGLGAGPAEQRFRPLPAAAGKDVRAEAAAGRGPRLWAIALRRLVGRLRAGGADGQREPGAGRAARAARAAGGGHSPERPPAGHCRSWPGSFPIDVQEAFGREAAAAIGFDFARGRLDVTAHPFCTTLGPHDCRITTHYDEHFFNAAFFGILHEAGHGTLRAGPAGGTFRPAAGRGRVAGHPRIAVADVGEPGRPQPGLLGAFLPRGAAAFPAALGGVALDDFISPSTTCGRR